MPDLLTGLNLVIGRNLPTQCVAGVQLGHRLGRLSPEELHVRLNVLLEILIFP